MCAGRYASVTAIQRFGGALNRNVHSHSLVAGRGVASTAIGAALVGVVSLEAASTGPAVAGLLVPVPGLQDGAVRVADTAPADAVDVNGLTALGVVDNVAVGPRADNQVGAGGVAAVDDSVGVVDAGGPAGGVAGVQEVLTVVVDDGDRAGQDVQEPVLGLVPVTVRGQGARGEEEFYGCPSRPTNR